jgi:predicted DNA-binding transcriptional regulator
MLEDIKASLQELGLSVKESDVYLSMLELGPASIQDIAKKAGVNRTTTYVMIEGLKRFGLVSTFDKGKKTFFLAETPQRLLALVSAELSGIERKRDRLQAQIPHLLAIFNTIQDKPKVRFIDGDSGISDIRREIVESREPIWEFYAVDELLLRHAGIDAKERIDMTKHLEGRALMAIKPGFVPPYFDLPGFEVRSIDWKRLPFTGDIAIVGKRVYAISLKTIGIGIVIESGEIADILKALYDLAWQSAKPWVPPAGWAPPAKPE